MSEQNPTPASLLTRRDLATAVMTTMAETRALSQRRQALLDRAGSMSANLAVNLIESIQHEHSDALEEPVVTFHVADYIVVVNRSPGMQTVAVTLPILMRADTQVEEIHDVD